MVFLDIYTYTHIYIYYIYILYTIYIYIHTYIHTYIHIYVQGRSQNLKEVPQNFTEVFSIDEVKDHDVIQRNQHRKEEK